MISWRRLSCNCLIILLFLLISACNHPASKVTEKAHKLHLDISPSVVLDRDEVTGNSLLQVKYIWKVGKQFRSDGKNLIAKVHFVNRKGDVLWQDDHYPTPGVASWKADSTVSYSRTVYVPLIPRRAEVSLIVGLYSQYENVKMLLNGISAGGDKYKVAAFTVLPPRRPEDLPGVHVQYGDGWYELEKNLIARTSWRWNSGSGRCILENPHHDATLYIKGWIPTSIYKKPSKVILKINNTVFAEYADLKNNFDILNKIPESMFQGKDSLILDIITDQTHVPSQIGLGQDGRRLGLMVKTLYFN